MSLIAVISTYNRRTVILKRPGGDYQPGQWGYGTKTATVASGTRAVSRLEGHHRLTRNTSEGWPLPRAGPPLISSWKPSSAMKR